MPDSRSRCARASTAGSRPSAQPAFSPSTSAAFWIRYGLDVGRMLAEHGVPPEAMEAVARELEKSWRFGQHLAARALRRGYRSRLLE
ncbi:hypothetical protein HQQ80_00500 [Microbacteriaceae bacterium VKM Ac-2855]|nr:hypothetical protein [Microbacteriaceae bacterium VKM Ac-2855]